MADILHGHSFVSFFCRKKIILLPPSQNRQKKLISDAGREEGSMTYIEIEKEILTAPRFKTIPSVENMRQYLAYFDHPESSFLVVHVAGTNGKGSTCSYLASILKKAGKKTGLFTSPHLITMRERIQINGELVDEQTVVRSYERVKEAQEKSGYPRLTFFELLTLLAVLIFQEHGVEYAVMETGMGGRYDATNALRPEICVITAIGMDHMQYLGDTIEKIAQEKAGIMKTGIPCVSVDHDPTVTKVLRTCAEEKKVPLCLLSEDSYKILNIGRKVIDFSVKSRYYINSLLSVCSRGIYQAENGAVAATAAKLLLPKLDDNDIRQGLLEANWPGRMEEIIPGIVVDGAHNEPSIQAFMNSVRRDGLSGERRILVFAVAADKDYSAMARTLLEKGDFHRIILTRIPYERMEDPYAIKPVFERYTIYPVEVEPEMETAYERAAAMREDEQVVYLVGSLYFVGSLKGYLQDKTLKEEKKTGRSAEELER